MLCLCLKCEPCLKKTDARGKADSILLLLFEYSQLATNIIHFSQ